MKDDNIKNAAKIMTAKDSKQMTNFDPVNNILDDTKRGEYFNPNLMPEIIKEILNQFMRIIFRDVPLSCQLNILLAKILEMISFKRVKFIEFANEKVINYFAFCLMSSGAGKDESLKQLKKHILNLFDEYRKEKVADYINTIKKQIKEEAERLFSNSKNSKDKIKYINENINKIRMIIFETNIATAEGIAADAQALKDAGFGGILIKISEIGLMLKNGRPTEIAFFNTLYQGYDGIVETKSIKSENRIEAIEDLPINALLYSDPTLFKNDLEHVFEMFMQTGLSRRCFLTFVSNYKKTIEENPLKEFEDKNKAYKNAKSLSEQLFDIFLKIPDNAKYKLTQKAYTSIFHEYKIYLTQKYNEENLSLLSKEIASRELKVLKLGCAFAALNHPDITEINELDIAQAINVVEYLSLDFEKFLKHKPVINDAYDELFEFLLDNLDKHYKKTELVRIVEKMKLFKRNEIRKNYNECLEVVSEIASAKGYLLNQLAINNNTGIEIWLSKAPAINDNCNELDEII